MTGAELRVRSLEAQGVEYVFGIPGAKIDGVCDALVDSRIRTIVCRHEQNAAFMAPTMARAWCLENSFAASAAASGCSATSRPMRFWTRLTR